MEVVMMEVGGVRTHQFLCKCQIDPMGDGVDRTTEDDVDVYLQLLQFD